MVVLLLVVLISQHPQTLTPLRNYDMLEYFAGEHEITKDGQTDRVQKNLVQIGRAQTARVQTSRV